jgi:hypothetical protein
VIVRLRRSTPLRDQYGDRTTTVPDDRLELVGAFTAPRASSEPTEPGRNGVTVGLTLYAAPGTELAHTDRIEVDGLVYTIEGEPGTHTNPLTGWAAGVVAELTRSIG